MRVTPRGVKSYILNYRVDGRERRLTIGRCAELSLRDARERAAREMVAIRAGEIDPLERRREKREAPTVRDGLVSVLRRVGTGPATHRTSHVRHGEGIPKARPSLREPRSWALKVPSVTKRHVERMVDGLPRTQHNRLLAFTSRLFRLFESWGWREQNTNPARGIERARETPT